MKVIFGKLSGIPDKDINEYKADVDRCRDELRDAEAMQGFHMSKGGTPDYDGDTVEYYTDLVEKRKTYLRQAMERLSWAQTYHLNNENFRTEKTVKEVLSQQTQKKKPSKKQLERNSKGGRGRATIDEAYKSIILPELDFMRNLTNKRKSEIIAERCASGEWKHNEKLTTIITRRTDGAPVTPNNVLRFIERMRPKENDKK